MKVLDHGLVDLLDVMGDDREPARAARVSYTDGIARTYEQDMKLTRYLLEHKHMSPFEMVEVKFKIKAPLFVARQLVRHRTANWNEFSLRYADPSRLSESDDIEFYVPDVIKVQDNENKQASGKALTEQLWARTVIESSNNAAAYRYYELIKLGVSREQARNVLPVTTYTQWVYKQDLRNLWGMLAQRDHEGAQAETREYAKAMILLLEEALPGLMGLWKETRYAAERSYGH